MSSGALPARARVLLVLACLATSVPVAVFVPDPGDGLRLTRPSAERQYLRLGSTRTFPDGAVELTYTFAAPTG